VRLWALLIVPALAAALAGCSTRSQRLYHRAEAIFAQGHVERALNTTLAFVFGIAGADEQDFKHLEIVPGFLS